ncbi:MAG: hypothetical protein AVDCRST_MAG68-2482 [uncultured Gemmatimonadetes bacterium]|uniref:Uncharacterized protein n=1 Tax=uncultured Gemmatimonadota bacterium TaxID=203437 RepID=A0A6J4LHV9_9BACT|nr:MAG: hypothetical protein AVDCRST_MAG68-2482 [uncultured Gemmatimonadota bacterium]
MKPRALLLLLSLAFIAPAAQATPPDAAWRARETARIQAHLLGAERMMESRDVSRLSVSQREARGRALAALRRYREAGRFPHNHQRPGFTPVFVDEHGTPCAMAYLIAESGSRALVRRVAATANLARIRELAPDPELAAWLRANGMTVAEAARVQPAYDGSGGNIDVSDEFVAPYAVASGLTAVANAGLMYLNHRASTPGWHRTWGGIGLLGGATQTAMGLSAWSDSDYRPFAAFNAAFGAASMVMGVRGLLHPDREEPLVAPVATRDGVGLVASLKF